MRNLKLDKLVCNKCSKELPTHSGALNTLLQRNLMHDFNVCFNYGSEYDMTKWKFTLCEKCILDFILTFEITPLSEECDSLG